MPSSLVQRLCQMSARHNPDPEWLTIIVLIREHGNTGRLDVKVGTYLRQLGVFWISDPGLTQAEIELDPACDKRPQEVSMSDDEHLR